MEEVPVKVKDIVEQIKKHSHCALAEFSTQRTLGQLYTINFWVICYEAVETGISICHIHSTLKLSHFTEVKTGSD